MSIIKIDYNVEDELCIKAINDKYEKCFKCDSSSDIKNAHSIQNNRYLKYISNKENLISFARSNNESQKYQKIASMYNKNKLNLYKSLMLNDVTLYKHLCSEEQTIMSKFDEIGRNSASVAKMFCDTHDTDLFKEIENNKIDFNNNSNLFKIYYRSLALAYHKAHYADSLIENLKDDEFFMPDVYFDKDSEYFEKLKTLCNNYIDSNITPNLLNFSLTLPYEIPIAISSMCMISTKQCSNKTIPSICFVLLPQDGITNVNFIILDEEIIGYETCNKINKEIISYLKLLSVSVNLEKLLSYLILICADEFYMNKQYWNSFSNDEKTKIEKYTFYYDYDISMSKDVINKCPNIIKKFDWLI